MVRLTIDQKEVEVPAGTTIMDAAAACGISIPSMCFQRGFSNHPSCMVCLVRDVEREHLIPSCAMPAEDGMKILTDTAEVREARRDAIELLLSDHTGDCEAPCRLACPAFMDIPLMNRLIASGDFGAALTVVREEIALPAALGYICPAPCEKACKRKPLGGPVSICLLKRSATLEGLKVHPELPPGSAGNGKRVAIIGAGPAGLSAAFFLLRSGHACTIYDRQEKPGGTLRYDIPVDRLPENALEADIGIIRNMGAEFRPGTVITGDLFRGSILPAYDAVILATGNSGFNMAADFGLRPDEQGFFADRNTLATSFAGVFACGSFVREHKMAVQSAAQGKMAASHVQSYLGTLPAGAGQDHHRRSESVTGRLSEQELQEYLKESIPGGRIIPAEKFPNGYTAEEAMHEAKRCLRCDCRKPASCRLRQYAREYGAMRRKFPDAERKQLSRMVQHDLVVFETEKCIRCGLCVEITSRRRESLGLTFIGRGFDVRIAIPFGKTIREGLTMAAAECASNCPTGALALKDQEERLTK